MADPWAEFKDAPHAGAADPWGEFKDVGPSGPAAAPAPAQQPSLLRRAANYVGEAASDALRSAESVGGLMTPFQAATGRAMAALGVPPPGVAPTWREEMARIRAGDAAAQARSPIASVVGATAPLLALGPGAAPYSSAAPTGAGLLPAATRAAAGTADAALYNAAGTAASHLDRPAAEIAQQTTSAATSPYNLVGAAGPLAVDAASAASSKLGSLAERAAVRSTFADRTAARRAFKGNEQARQDLGRWMLDQPGMQLRSPADIKESAQDIQRDAGARIGQVASDADAAGVKVDLARAVTAAKNDPAVSRLGRNTETRPYYERVIKMLDEQQRSLAGQTMGYTTPSSAHDLRMQLDQLATWDKSAPTQVQNAWRAARQAVDGELDAAMKKSGLSDAWDAANRDFSQARRLSNPKASGLADVGAERRSHNRFVSPYEALAGAASVPAAFLGHPETLALPAAAWVTNRYAMPAAARTLDALAGAGGPAARASVLPRAQAVTEAWLRSQALRPAPLFLAPAAANQGNER